MISPERISDKSTMITSLQNGLAAAQERLAKSAKAATPKAGAVKPPIKVTQKRPRPRRKHRPRPQSSASAPRLSLVYLVVEDDGAVSVVEVLEVVLDGVLAGTDEEGEAGVEGAVDVVWSDVLGAVSFFSPVVAIGAHCLRKASFCRSSPSRTTRCL